MIVVVRSDVTVQTQAGLYLTANRSTILSVLTPDQQFLF